MTRTYEPLQLSRPVICVVGPTASGKTDVAQEVARRLDGEVVSADSMQIYRGMNIGTGTISEGERLVPHYGLDICEPGTPYSAALFQDYARACFSDMDARGKRGVLAGGTGLYVRAAIDDYRFPKGEQEDNPVREKWQRFLDEYGQQTLWDELNRMDPASAEIIHPHNAKRVMRALEMLETEGVSYAQQHEGFKTMEQFVSAYFFGLAVEPELLKTRINARVDRMVESGLVAEVQQLLDQGFQDALTAREAIGYKEIVAALRGECTLEESIEAIKLATRRYAKRQRTWWRGDERVMWIDADDADVSRMADEIVRAVQQCDAALSA